MTYIFQTLIKTFSKHYKLFLQTLILFALRMLKDKGSQDEDISSLQQISEPVQ